MTASLVAALTPLVSRVRTDVTAVKKTNGAQAWTDQPLTEARVFAHVSGGKARGVCPIHEGSSTTRVALLDFDSHKGEVSWDDMAAVALQVVGVLEMLDMAPVLWRSSGGRGIHLFLIWDAEQDAYSVRQMLTGALTACGLKNGARGVKAGEVEVFPKQDSVPIGGFGNQFVLPLAGESVPLIQGDGSLRPVPREAALSLKWPVSDPVVQLEKPERVVQPVDAVRDHAGRDGALAELVDLLDAIPNATDLAGDGDELGYDDWWRVVAGIHHATGGSEEGLALAHDFSARSGKHEPAFLDERIWPFIHSDRGQVVGLGTLRHIAARYGWRAPIAVDDLEDLSGLDDRPPMPAGKGQRFDGGLGKATSAGEDDGAAKPIPDHVGNSRVSGALGASVGAAAVSRAPAPVSVGGSVGEAPGRPEVPTPEAIVKRRGIPEAKHWMTDLANANRLVKAFGTQMLVAASQWHAWDGKRWVPDDAEVYRYGCRVSQIIHDEAKAIRAKADPLDLTASKKANAIADALDKWALRSEMKGTIEAAIGLARKMLTVPAEMLNRNSWLLNCDNGTVDLRTGELHPHDPADFITKITPVRYVPGAGCDLWLKTLREVLCEPEVGPQARAGDASVVAFFQRWAGYCLTAETVEQAFVVHWGSGANGKSSVLGMLATIMGDYAGAAPPGLLMASKGERHPAEIAHLFGLRMVTAHETAENVALREDFVKQATGGDKISARRMHQDFFEFDPTHKLQLLTNHKPTIKGTDPGIWRRVLLLPYQASFGSAEDVVAGTRTAVADAFLSKRLQAEREGVLAWAVRGAVEWAAAGLRPPASIKAASAGYRVEQDRLAQFVAECCELDMAAREPLTDGMGGLYPAFQAWCREGGVLAMSKQRFVADILRVVPGGAVEPQFSPRGEGKRRKLTVVRGIRLLPD